MIDYRLTTRAMRDVAAARRWYDEVDSQLGNQFLDAIQNAIDVVRSHPETFKASELGVRTIRCRRFPYRLYYRSLSDHILVLAVYHTSRDPDRWDDSKRR